MNVLKRDVLGYIQRYLHILVWYDDDDSPRNIFSNMENILNKNEEEAYHHTIDIFYLLMKMNLITYIDREYTDLLAIEEGVIELVNNYSAGSSLVYGGWAYYFYPTEICYKLIKELDLDYSIHDYSFIDDRFDKVIHEKLSNLSSPVTIFNSIFESEDTSST